jgi:Fe(3+) dicitrate transport protein
MHMPGRGLAHAIGIGAISLGGLALASNAAGAEDPPSNSDILWQMHVIGRRSEVSSIPGSAHYISYEDIREFAYDDINRVLQQVPGVYLRQEDGYGLFPNISLRGVDTTRSSKVSLMEDGILAAPAPYAAPSAYYSPTTGRMDALEVLKGTSQAKYGPHITGGVINYLSTAIPEDRRAFLRSQYGEDDDLRMHAVYGDTVAAGGGRVGYLLEAYVRSTDGFKTIDAAPDFDDTGDTGFYSIEPMVKLAFEPDSAVYQRFEFKYGHTDKVADETYLGLSTADFRDDPERRYSASRFDEISTEHHRTYLRHFISPNNNLDVVTTAYYNEFRRNWYKLNDIRSAAGGLATNLDLSAALAGASGGMGLACLRGDLACGLRVRANDRSYYAWGVQSEAELRLAAGGWDHEMSFGLRYHRDEEDRFQHDDIYRQANDGSITGVSRGAPGSQDDREAEVGAVAIYLQDRIERGNWLITPGIRFETLDLESRDFRPGGATEDTSLDMLAGGIGAAYTLGSAWQVLGGIHFGFSPPSPGAAVDGLDEETSTGYELGFRYADPNGILLAEAVGFYTEFEDLIVISNIGGAGTGEDENFGEVRSIGAEFHASFDLGLARRWSFSNPWFITFTYTSAEQRNDAQSTDPESIFSFGAKGNAVPYIPEYQLTVGSSVDFARWGASVTANLVDDTFTSANNASAEINGAGVPDARFGKTDAFEVVDLSVYAKPREQIKLFAGVHNLFDDEYIVSRQPHGPRPGLPRSWFVGMEIEL